MILSESIAHHISSLFTMGNAFIHKIKHIKVELACTGFSEEDYQYINTD
jgi:isochorismate hydrolase